jgi:hypothetical protein
LAGQGAQAPVFELEKNPAVQVEHEVELGASEVLPAAQGAHDHAEPL